MTYSKCLIWLEFYLLTAANSSIILTTKIEKREKKVEYALVMIGMWMGLIALDKVLDRYTVIIEETH